MIVIYKILSWILNLIPRSSDILVFSSFPDYTDNAYAFYEYIRDNRLESYKCIWIYSDKASKERYIGVRGYYKFSIGALWYFMRARYVFCTHGLYGFLSVRQKNKIVNLWHGMPLKTIGCLDAMNKGMNPTKADYLIATSPLFREIMSKAFNNLPEERIFITGQPRNDLLFKSTDFFQTKGIKREGYSTIGIWLPTYKQSNIGDIRQDGVFNDNGIAFLSMDDMAELDAYLRSISSLLIVKLHPMDALQNLEFKGFSNILVLKQKDFNSQLYPLLGATDFLLTDYSSVWVDYCILRKPIGFVMCDMDEYRKSRGFTIDDLAEKLPGRCIDSLEKLKCFILHHEYEEMPYLGMYNVYFDNRSSERLMNALGL